MNLAALMRENWTVGQKTLIKSEIAVVRVKQICVYKNSFTAERRITFQKGFGPYNFCQ